MNQLHQTGEPVEEAIPALSVVMPAYNAEKYVQRAVESILEQTFQDLELVIVDDASTDRTLEIIKGLAVTDARIRVFHNAENLGVSDTTNFGVSKARADLIGRMDADDMSDPTRFEKQIAVLRANPHFAVVGSFASHTNDRGQILSLSPTGPRSEAQFDDLRLSGETTMVFGGTALFRKDLFEKAGGYDPSIGSGEDVELFDRMANLGPIVSIPEPLLLYRLHQTSLVQRTFLDGRRVHRFIKARRVAQAAGQELDLASYATWEQNRPLHHRIRVALDDQSQLRYREAGMAYGNGDRGRFVGLLLLALAANPVFVVRRLWNQRLSPAARAQTDAR